MLKLLKFLAIGIFHIIMIISLTLMSQVGGIVWLLSFLMFQIFWRRSKFLIRLSGFIAIYSLFTYFVIPPLAAITGKVPLPRSSKGNLIAHHPLYHFLSRNYVTPQTKKILLETADRVQERNPELKLVYLDSSFPFSKEMPLFPHISHSNGRKVDLTFVYRKDGKVVHHGSSFTGYGNFEGPREDEYNQIRNCLERGNYLYDYSKFAGFLPKDVSFDQENTKLIIEELLKNRQTRRLIIEPHLKKRMKINNDRVRFAGCWAVRHDDHIHYEL